MTELIDKVELANTESNTESVAGSVVAEVHTMRTADNNLCMVLVLVIILHFDVEMLTGHHRLRALRQMNSHQSDTRSNAEGNRKML